MPLRPGQLLLHYRIVEKIGEGGMGVVWKAVDTTLDREVAIKVLPSALASDAERLQRFEREAKLLASLNHPNIASVYSVHEGETPPGAGQATRFIVMEYVGGEDLATTLARGRIPLEESLQIARRIAEALETAHERGVIHRDLKPANVKVTADGTVKVLDLGLAKALVPETLGADTLPSMSPTVTSAGTANGLILGTAAYMAPEQAKGRAVDRRADIWAFGVLLFEMLTGRQPFRGETVSETLASVLRDEVDLDALPSDTPRSLRQLIERCVDRDPQTRLQAIGEARILLVRLIRTGPAAAAQETVPPAAASGRRRGIALLAVAAVAAAAFAAGYFLRDDRARSTEGLRSRALLRRLTFEPGLEHEPTLSPDGNYVAYTTDVAGNLDVVVLPLAGGAEKRITDHEADDAQPAWSPDGLTLAFVSGRDRKQRLAVIPNISLLSGFVAGAGGDIFLVPALGGTPVKLVDDGSSPAWSPSGAEIAFQSQRSGQWDIWIVPVDGSAPPRRLSSDDAIDFEPAWSPDGRFIAYGSNRGVTGLVVHRIEDGEEHFFEYDGLVMSPEWSRDGRFLYFASDRAGAGGAMNLWRAPFSPSDPGRVQEPERVTLSEGSDIEPTTGSSGLLAFSRVRYTPDIWELTIADGSLRQITRAPSAEDYPHVSRDDRLAMVSDRGGSTIALWTMNLDGSDLSPVTPSQDEIQAPRWSPDGRRLAFVIRRAEETIIAIRAPGDLTLSEVARFPRARGANSPEWSPDGRFLAYYVSEGEVASIWVHPLDGGEPRRLVSRPGLDQFPTWSPDGRRIAYNHEDDLLRQVWVVDVGETGDGVGRRITRDDTIEFSHPQWSPSDPDRIAVVLDHRNVGVVSVATGEVEMVTHFDESTVLVDYPSWSSDGRKIYFSLARKLGDVFVLQD